MPTRTANRNARENLTDRLAIHGGDPFITERAPLRNAFDQREVDMAVKAIRSQNLFGPTGNLLPRFERNFAATYGVEHAVGSTSGTAAIHLAMGALDPEPGDEIITTPITDAGTIVPILLQNCVPVFADVDDAGNLDPEDVEARITGRTRAILTVHLFGNPCEMDRMVRVAARHNLPVIEDCSQAHMTPYRGKLAGTIGDIGCFSFQQSKHMTTGDGGMTITRDDDYAHRMRLFQDKGWIRPKVSGARVYAFLAPNYRMTELHAAVGVAQLEKVEAAVAGRHALGRRLTALIDDVPGVAPLPETSGASHSYFYYPLRILEADAGAFAAALDAEGVGCSAGYIGVPMYLAMEALASKKTFGASGHPLDGCHGGRVPDYAPGLCPRAERFLTQLVVIGVHEQLSMKNVEDMAGAIRKVAAGLGPE